MITKQQIKDIRALASRKGRAEAGLFTVEGEKLVVEAIDSDYQIVSIYKKEEIGEINMSKISQLSSPSPVLAVVRIPDRIPDPDENYFNDLSIALDSVRDPGNMGTIIRIADWFGIKNLFLSEDSVDIYNSKVIQASMGAIFRIKITYCDLKTVTQHYIDRNLPIWGTFLTAPSIYGTDLSNKGLILFGNESNGISPEISIKVTDRISIPSYPGDSPTSESLNVASAVSIVCAEFRRRSGC